MNCLASSSRVDRHKYWRYVEFAEIQAHCNISDPKAEGTGICWDRHWDQADPLWWPSPFLLYPRMRWLQCRAEADVVWHC